MKAKLSPWLQSASGSIGTITVQTKVEGLVVKQKEYKDKKRKVMDGTTGQPSGRQKQNATFGDVVRAWNDLSQVNCDSWEIVAANLNNSTIRGGGKAQGILGGKSQWCGYVLHQYSNQNLQKYNGNMISTAPTDLTIPASTPPTYFVDTITGLFEVHQDLAALPADTVLLVLWSNQYKAGINIKKNKLVFFQSYNDINSFPLDIAADYIAKFGALVTGKKTAIGFQLMNLNNGFKSKLIISQAITT